MSRAFRLGITGKIGSGKSTFSELARKNGINVLQADSIAKIIMSSEPEVRKKIEDVFGNEAYIDGVLNPPYLASKIFTDDSLRNVLEEIVHPATLKVIRDEFQKASNGEIIALETAILFQTGLDEMFDAVILIDANDIDIIHRKERDGKFSHEDIINRLNKQHFLNEWKEDADFVIANNSSEQEFKKRSEELLKVVKIIANQELPEESLRSIIE